MSASPAGTSAEGAVRPSIRWSLPAGLLVTEYAALSLLVDFPISGPALRVATAARMLVPAALGALAAGWLISRNGMRAVLREMAGTLPPWRPWGPLAAQLSTFGATAWLAWTLLGSDAPPVAPGSLLVLLLSAAACAILAATTAAPLKWLARFAWLHLGAPTAAVAVGMVAWRTATLAEGLWGVLQGATLRAVGALLLMMSPRAVVLPDQSIVGLGGFDVVIAPVCSGVDGLGLVLVFQTLWISLARTRLRVRRALLLLVVGAAAAVTANVLRITALLVLGASGHEDLAMGGFHSKVGWLLFVGIAFATIAVAEHVAWFRRPGAATSADDEGVPRRAAAYVGPLVAAIAASLLTSMWASAAFDRWYAARALAAGLVLLAARKDLPRAALSLSWMPILVGAAVGAIWIASTSAEGAAPSAGLAQLSSPARAAWIAARVASACLVLPVVEELAFRGFLLPWLVAPQFDTVPARAWTWPAVILSSVAFGAMHDGLLLGALAGAAFAYARSWRGRLSDAVVAHAVANAVIAAAVLGFGRWDLWR